MTDGDGAAIYIQLRMIDAELSLASQDLRSKCFVDFETIDLIQAQAVVLENGPDGRDRADTHDFRRYPDSGAGDDAGQRLSAVLAHECPGRNKRSARAIYYGGTVAAGLHSSEHGADFGQDFDR